MLNEREITQPLVSPLDGWVEPSEVAPEPITAEVWPTFDDFWSLYAYKIDRTRCERIWKKLPQADREGAMRHAEQYVQTTYTDGRYPSRRHPGTYLHNRNWNDGALIVAPRTAGSDAAASMAELASRFVGAPQHRGDHT